MSDALVWYFLAISMLDTGSLPKRSESFDSLLACERAAVLTMRAQPSVYVLQATRDNEWSCFLGRVPAAPTVHVYPTR